MMGESDIVTLLIGEGEVQAASDRIGLGSQHLALDRVSSNSACKDSIVPLNLRGNRRQ